MSEAQTSEPRPQRLPTREGYDRWAAIYDDDANPLVLLEQRVLPRVLGEVTAGGRGLAVADVGCGTGRHALALAAAGARVTAIDFSDGMLAAARAKAGAERVEWVQHDLAERLPLADGSFNRVLCALVLDHIADVAGLFGELGRICRPDGFIVVTSMHPALMLKGVEARFIDPETGERRHVLSVPNQISDYVMGAVRANLRIEHMSEHAADEALAGQTERAARYLGWPMLLVMKMRR